MNYTVLLFIFSGILSQRMFVMLPCGGVGVRNMHTHIHSSIFGHSYSPISSGKPHSTTQSLVEIQYYLKKKSRKRKLEKRQDIKKEKRVGKRLADSPCRTMTSETNKNSMSMTEDKRNLWFHCPSQMDSNATLWTNKRKRKKHRMERGIFRNMDLASKSGREKRLFSLWSQSRTYSS